MEFHRGRLIDHVHLRVTDLAASKRFYAAVFAALGRLANDDATQPGLEPIQRRWKNRMNRCAPSNRRARTIGRA